MSHSWGWVWVLCSCVGIVLRLAVVVGEELAVICFDTPELSASIMVDSSAESAGPGEGVRSRVNEGNKLSLKEVEEGSLGVGSLGSGFSSFERDTDLLMTGVSSGKWSPFDFSIAMTGASFDRDTLRSRSFVIDRRTELKAPKGLRVLGEVEREVVVVVVAFLLDPKGKRERSERKEGIPELAGEAGVGGE